jgi:hypothetical protein
MFTERRLGVIKYEVAQKNDHRATGVLGLMSGIEALARIPSSHQVYPILLMYSYVLFGLLQETSRFAACAVRCHRASS